MVLEFFVGLTNGTSRTDALVVLSICQQIRKMAESLRMLNPVKSAVCRAYPGREHAGDDTKGAGLVPSGKVTINWMALYLSLWLLLNCSQQIFKRGREYA